MCEQRNLFDAPPGCDIASFALKEGLLPLDNLWQRVLHDVFFHVVGEKNICRNFHRADPLFDEHSFLGSSETGI